VTPEPSDTKPPVDQLSREQTLEIHRYLRLNRALEERLALLYRQNRVYGGLYCSLGQEGCSVGAAYALGSGDIFSPMIRNIGAVLVRGARLVDLFAQYLGRDGPTHGRESGVHFGWISETGCMLPVVSTLGDMVPLLVGATLAERLRNRSTVALTFVGDGGVSTGTFHEGFNLACVLKAPLVVIVESNRFALSTPTERQTANPRFVDRARAYGCFGESVDGTDVLAVYEVTRQAVERARRGLGPTLIEADLLRRSGHTEHDDAAYVPAALREEWERKDPIERYERHLVRMGLANETTLLEAAREVERMVDWALREAEALPMPAPETLLRGVYADRDAAPPEPPLVQSAGRKSRESWRT
jgi:pyruvate dehydrogenase E1 component alpha subunit/2-oxoisovalerate dehydrogenase E1 component alpha subunit